jgi:hypothetical protein
MTLVFALGRRLHSQRHQNQQGAALKIQDG